MLKYIAKKQYTSDDTTTLIKNHALLETYENKHSCALSAYALGEYSFYKYEHNDKELCIDM